MVSTIIKVLIQILAGMGIAWGADKILPDKLPTYEPIKPFKSITTTALTILALAAGALLVNFLGKKFNIKLLKTR